MLAATQGLSLRLRKHALEHRVHLCLGLLAGRVLLGAFAYTSYWPRINSCFSGRRRRSPSPPAARRRRSPSPAPPPPPPPPPRRRRSPTPPPRRRYCVRETHDGSGSLPWKLCCMCGYIAFLVIKGHIINVCSLIEKSQNTRLCRNRS